MRLQSNELLARELLLAVRRRLPLVEALVAFTRTDARVPRWVWNTMAFMAMAVVALAYAAGGLEGLVFAAGLIMIVIVLAGSGTQSEDYRRYMGFVLCRELRRGRTLGEAFRRHPELFEPFEATLFAAADRSGRVEQSLQAWSRHSDSSERLNHTGDMALYPVTVVLIVIAGLSFYGTFMLARVQDIYAQLWPSDRASGIIQVALLFLKDTIGERGFLLLFFVALFAFLSVAPRRFFNGSVAGSMIFMFLSMVGVMGLFWYFVNFFQRPLSRWIPSGYLSEFVMAGVALSILLGFGMGYLSFRAGRWLSGRGSGVIVKLLSFLPLLRSGQRHLDESRFLFALEALLQSGREWPEAFEEAGRAVGRRQWARAGRKAAAEARRGYSPADVVSSIPTLLPSTRTTLSIADFGGRFLESLCECAEQDHRIGHRNITRFNAIFYPVTHLVAGSVAGLFIIMIYIPILMFSSTVPYGG